MPKLVVVIDDERPIRDLVSTLLTEEGWPVRTFSSAVSALQEITSGAISPDVILLDMRMPGMDGPQFADAIRAHSPDVPIVVMTAARDARQWAEAISAAGYIPKPFDIDWVIDTVVGVIGEPESAPRNALGSNGTSEYALLPIPAAIQHRIRQWVRGNSAPATRLRGPQGLPIS